MGIRGSIMKDSAFESNHRDTLLYAIECALRKLAGIELDLRTKHYSLREDSYEANSMMRDIEKVEALQRKLGELFYNVQQADNNRRVDEYYQEYLALYTVLQMTTR